ncbi:hypothetical protein [Streptomyces avidinii]|uniref:ABC-type Fe3+-hydroxamate transport system substrate-binding protein n=1 Tax=Streptomyces avidinii TaxID=1895 RepID=A0ABS4KZM6_STRAV|nr:hypothetical protein [Streptomyces avidinii]MBP2035491.1 ABC-type Fe3+-hydroxamate transport system substrate-binding protein [Streptomyces avidinii]GGZ02102.1 hypothetical protein GCM10010343_29650 [Streptomyces avidinii]
MLKRFALALSVTATALLLPAAGVAQAADDTSAAATATTATTTTGDQGGTTAQTPRRIVTANGTVVTVGTGTLGHRNRDTADSSWGG